MRFLGLGYCFSASLPPLLATAAREALKIIDDDSGRVQRLTQVSQQFHKGLVKALEGTRYTNLNINFNAIFLAFTSKPTSCLL
jgi:serine palmitoyltransferase